MSSKKRVAVKAKRSLATEKPSRNQPKRATKTKADEQIHIQQHPSLAPRTQPAKAAPKKKQPRPAVKSTKKSVKTPIAPKVAKAAKTSKVSRAAKVKKARATTPFTFGGTTLPTPSTWANSFDSGEDLTKEQIEFPDRVLKSTGPDTGLTEIVFIFDTTGSMSSAIEECKKDIRDAVGRLIREAKIRVAVMAMGDYCDVKSTYLLKTMDFSTSPGEIEKFVTSCGRTTGGDGPEAIEYAFMKALELSWTPGSNRNVVYIGDSLPHTPSVTKAQMTNYGVENPQDIDWRVQADKLYENGIKVIAVQALNQAPSTPFYKAVAARTTGTYVQLSAFAAVTDALLAITFREVSQEKFENFVAEVQSEGRMDAGRKKMFRQISKEISARGRSSSKTIEKAAKETPAEESTTTTTTTTTSRSSSKGLSRSKSKTVEKETTTEVAMEDVLVPEKEKQLEKTPSKTMSRSKSKGSAAKSRE